MIFHLNNLDEYIHMSKLLQVLRVSWLFPTPSTYIYQCKHKLLIYLGTKLLLMWRFHISKIQGISVCFCLMPKKNRIYGCVPNGTVFVSFRKATSGVRWCCYSFVLIVEPNSGQTTSIFDIIKYNQIRRPHWIYIIGTRLL